MPSLKNSENAEILSQFNIDDISIDDAGRVVIENAKLAELARKAPTCPPCPQPAGNGCTVNTVAGCGCKK